MAPNLVDPMVVTKAGCSAVQMAVLRAGSLAASLVDHLAAMMADQMVATMAGYLEPTWAVPMVGLMVVY